ncbi:MAG TPA: DUF3365 domain-containing protein [Burkholderiales bacterium]|nr:DUF3365 domain-containing protein [Burkholderiales bacterium]
MMPINTAIAAILVLWTLAGRADESQALLTSSREAAAQLTTQLGGQLRKELSTTGPDGAIAVCKSIAPEIAGKLSRETGARVARVSLRVRNPLLGTPDAWEQQRLAEFDRRVAAGEKAEVLEAYEIVREPEGRYWRYLKAIPVEPLCLACHGPLDGLPEPVKARLQQDYPHDQAVGYQPGQVRGAVTVKQRLVD